MNKEKFLHELSLILGAPDNALRMDMLLADFRGWDSMGKMAALTLIDTDLGVPVPYDLLEKCRTVGELLAFAEPHLAK
ncbi:MAG: hypothetical protein PSW75_10440 [bacterium]|nr:hypothetical protein [bacterium]